MYAPNTRRDQSLLEVIGPPVVAMLRMSAVWSCPLSEPLDAEPVPQTLCYTHLAAYPPLPSIRTIYDCRNRNS